MGDWDRVSGGWTHSLLEQVVLVVKNPPASAGVPSSIPGLGGFPRGGHSNLQSSCLENPMDRGAWRTIVHGVAETRLKRLSRHTSFIVYLPSLMWSQEAPS